MQHAQPFGNGAVGQFPRGSMGKGYTCGSVEPGAYSDMPVTDAVVGSRPLPALIGAGHGNSAPESIRQVHFSVRVGRFYASPQGVRFPGPVVANFNDVGRKFGAVFGASRAASYHYLLRFVFVIISGLRSPDHPQGA